MFFFASIIYSIAGQAEVTSDFFFFPQADFLTRSGLVQQTRFDGDHHDSLDASHQEAGVDLFLSLETGNFRLLAEYLLSTEVQHIERFQLGWLFGNQLVWLGRFHNPVGYWNSRYHHGAFLQTSISRPSIVKYEDHGGILPMHQAGLLAEGFFGGGMTGPGYSLALAMGPEFDGELKPWDVLDPSEGERDTSITLNLFLEQEAGRMGLFANANRIPSSLYGLDEIKQRLLGAYIDRELDRWRVHAAFYYVENRLLQTAGQEKDSFTSAYLQAELQVDDSFTLFGRLEGTAGSEGDAYLELFPHFVEDRVLGGVRLDFTRQNALKLELSVNRTQNDEYSEVMLQWSAQF